MSSYRDDTHEIAVASDKVISKLKAVAEDSTKITASLLFTLLVVTSETAAASDELFGNVKQVSSDSATISDSVTDSLSAKILVSEKAKANDSIKGKLRVIHSDSAGISEHITDRQRSIITEAMQATDLFTGTRKAFSLATEKAKIGDSLVSLRVELIEESLSISDLAIGKMRAKFAIDDSVAIYDTVIDSLHSGYKAASDSVTVSDFVIDKLHAKGMSVSSAVIEDTLIVIGDTSQAWTANTENWAMTRYEPYTFNSAAVINGIAYGLNDSGVYALNGGTETITATVTTGKVDIGQGALAHPVSAYLEYELEGTAEMDVTTTQSGLAQTFTYPLATEVANELTNGRFIFGRGLRGRHFSFTLRITGLAGYINDLSVTSTPTKRRV